MLPKSHCMLKAKNLSFIFLEEAFSNSCESFISDCVQYLCSVLCVHAHDFFWARWFTIWKYMHILIHLIIYKLVTSCTYISDPPDISSTHWSLWWKGCVQLRRGKSSSTRETRRANWWPGRAGWQIQVMAQPSSLLEKLKNKSQNCHTNSGEKKSWHPCNVMKHRLP